MSYDLAVWYSDFPLSTEDAGSLYQSIDRDWVFVAKTPVLRDFCLALMNEFPGVLDPAILDWDFAAPSRSQLMTYADLMAGAAGPGAPVPATEPPPWRVIAGIQGPAMTMSLGSRKAEIEAAIRRLAAAHDLVFYNPQSGEAILPPRLSGSPPVPLPEPVRMIIEEQPGGFRVRISFEGRDLFVGRAGSRRDAHDIARAQTIALDRPAYQVDDRRAAPMAMGSSPRRASAGSTHVFDLLTEFAKTPRRPKDGS